MTEKIKRPILFNGEMVRAILDGRKTQTRMVIKDQEAIEYMDETGEFVHAHNPKCQGYCDYGCKYVSPYGKVGDQLWVRETWGCFDQANDTRAIAYRADDFNGEEGECFWFNVPDEHYHNEEYCPSTEKWKPSIHMFQWASRITLEITAIRIERLQDITEEDAKKEGVPMNDNDGVPYLTYKSAFMALWDRINFKRGFGWEKNPWVWVVEFKKVEK